MPFKPTEIATIEVNGTLYRDWETVLVHFGLQEQPPAYFRFTCSEGMPLAKDFAAIRIRPGDYCSITLAGQHSLSGMVTVRQVAYTADQHGIQIIGEPLAGKLSNAAAQTQTGEFIDKNFTQIAAKMTQQTGVKFIPTGRIDNTPFPRVNIPPGASWWETLEPLATSRAIPLGTNETGHLTGGVTAASSGEKLIEGINILEGRETISIQAGSGEDVSLSQYPVDKSEQKWGAQVASVPYAKEAYGILGMLGSQGAYSPRVTIAEHPGNAEDMKTRSGFEGFKRDVEQINVQIVVYGWLTSGGTLWQTLIGSMVYVRSPMLIMDRELMLREVTYTQDDRSGTRTTLVLTNNPDGKYADLS